MSKVRSIRRCLSITAWCLLLGVVGCGSGKLPTYPVTGTVTFADGKPVAFGQIELYNAEHDLTARGKIQPDGTFELGTFADRDGAVAGQHQAIVVQIRLPGQLGKERTSHGQHVDARYADFSTAKLEFNVSSEQPNHWHIKLDQD